VRNKFRRAANATTKEEPFLCGDEAGLIKNFFVNAISSICSTNFILQDLGQACKQETFIFGFTFEDNWDHKTRDAVDHVKKIRVLLMRESKLARLEKLTEKDVRFQSDTNHHKMRFLHLQKLQEAWAEELVRSFNSMLGNSMNAA
jgi:hypothetical protein